MKKTSLNEIILNILIISIYLWDVLDAIVPEGALILMLLILVIELTSLKAPTILCKKSVLGIILIIVFHSVVCILLDENNIILFSKSFIGITISYLAYAIALKKYSVKYIFEKYYKISVFVATFGLFQEMAFLLRWAIFYDKSYLFSDRTYEGIEGVGLLPISCFFQEQSFLAFSLISAAYFSVCILLNQKYFLAKTYSKVGAIIILVCCLLSFSTTVYLGILLSFIFCGINSKKFRTKIAICCLFVLLLAIFYLQIDMFRLRLDDMLKLLFNGDFDQANLSSMTLFLNMKVAVGNFFRTFGLGSGLGSYKMVYEKLLGFNAISHLNAADGNSLFNRITAELGLAGLVGVYVFLRKNVILSRNIGFLKIVNHSCIVCFFMRLLRNGNYFHLSFMFFVVLFIQSKKENILENKLEIIYD